MGYSTPKKPLDLKEFLSTPAKKKPQPRRFPATRPKPVDATPEPSDDTAS